MHWFIRCVCAAVLMVESVPVPVGAQPVEADTEPPVLRHSAPTEPTIGETLVIQAVVEDESEVTGVAVWYRPVGGDEFQQVEAVRRIDDNRLYDVNIVLTSAFGGGLEYYIDATDQFGNRGTDGSDTMPYFVEVRALPALSGLSTGSADALPRPWWKRRWVWITAVAVVAGGIAISANRGDETGTVVVE